MPFMDHFLEEVVTKRNNTVNRIIYYFKSELNAYNIYQSS